MATKQTPKKTGLAVLHTELCGYVQVERAFREQLAEVHGERLTKLEAQVMALYDDFATHRKIVDETDSALIKREDQAVTDMLEHVAGLHRALADHTMYNHKNATWNLAINIGVTLGACVVTYFLGQWTR